MENKKVLVIGHGLESKSELAIQYLKEKYGQDVEVFTPEEAKEKGLTVHDFENLKSIKITAPPPLIELPKVVARGYNIEQTGRAKRRERRKQNRNKF